MNANGLASMKRTPFSGATRPGGQLGHRRMKGQALILFVISLLVLCIGVIVLFNTGQAVTKKVELVNAADAAAYSAAVEQARAYNLVAYMNRAEVANEVAVAQMVTIYSMTNYVLSATKNLKKTARNLSYALYILGIFTEGATVPIANAFQRVASILGNAQSAITNARNGMQTPFSAGIRVLSQVLNGAYSNATNLIARIAPADAAHLAKKIVEENTYGKARIGARGVILLANQYRHAAAYTKRYSLAKRSANAGGADRFANVVMEARDGFSRERSAETAFGAIKKRGGTDIVTSSKGNHYYDSFVAADTLNFYVRIPWWLGGGKIDLPLAWGGAAATNQIHFGFSRVALQGYRHGRGWDSPYTTERRLHVARYGGAVDNHRAGRNVRNDPAVGQTSKGWLKGYVGLHDYDDIVDDKATVPYFNGKSAKQNGVNALDVGPLFTVAIEQRTNTVRTSDSVEGVGGPPDFEVHDTTIKGNMTALSSAQVYFDRPRGLFDNIIDSRREIGSLFSPYWQARLVDTPCNERQLIAVSYGSVAPCVPGQG